jgi:hypothetical protein
VEFISVFDYIYSGILILILSGWAGSYSSKNIQKHAYYKVFKKGLLIKITGAVLFCLIYVLYYGGGDTTNYYIGVKAMNAVFLDNPIDYLKLLFLEDGSEARKYFWNVRLFPPNYMLRDYRTFLVIKITSIFSLPGLGGFLPTTIILATFAYLWIWKLYTFLAERYTNHIKELNISILFLPSTIFWGSGIMKDTFTFAATCYAVFGLHQLIIKREKKLSNIVQLIVAFYLILTIKSYILFALLPGILIFANFERIKKIQSTFVKIIIIPTSLIGILFLSNLLFVDFSDSFGRYSSDKILEEAVIMNKDLQRSVYGSNSFDIGEFEPNLQGVSSKIIPAINASIFRPYLWEIGSPTMVLSGIENIILLVLSSWLIIHSPFYFIKKVFSDPFLLFCLLFTLILGFGVGLSTSNFGALVRYKIPFLPFYTFLILYFIKKKKKLI